MWGHFILSIIIKPNYESESIGITQNSIVSDIIQADCLIRDSLEEFDGILIEEYIEGNEIAITIFGNENDLFFEEVKLCFPEDKCFKYKAYTLEIKQNIEIEIKKSNYLTGNAKECIKQFYYSLAPGKLLRIDGRIKNSEFYMIEVNANPGLYPKSVVPRTFNIYGYSYSAMLKRLFIPTIEKF